MATTYDLNGKTVLVTGAARGIGLGLARAVHGRGASVALLDLDLARTQQAAAQLGGDRVLALAADVTDEAALEAAVAETVERFGGLDVSVANAGIASQAATARTIAPDVFERVIDVNLLGVWRTVRATLPEIVQRRGQAVLVASVYAFVNGAMEMPYAVAKAGVEQLGRALRTELAIHGASATVAYYGFVDTEMVRQGIDADPLAHRFEEAFPRPLRKRITPAAAGEALARGIERRAPRVIAPRRWAALSMLRGIVNPLLDRYSANDRELREIVADVEQRAAGQTMGIVAAPADD